MIALAEDMKSVLRRWNPAALDDIDRIGRVVPSGVHVTGTSGSGKSAVTEQLRRIDPGIEFTDSADAAAAVLIVVDAAAPVGRVDIEQWRRAMESTPVAVAVNKIDAHRQWRDVLAADRRTISEQIPLAVECSWHPVSARLADDVLASASDDEAWIESGMGDLVRWIRATLDAAPSSGVDHKVAAAVFDAVSRARRAIVAKARVATAASETASLRADRAALSSERSNSAADRQGSIRHRMQVLRVEALHAVAEEVRVIGTRTRGEVEGASRAELAHLPARFGATMDEMARRAESALTIRLREAEDDLSLPSAVPEPEPFDPAMSSDGPRRRRGVEDRLVIVLGASAGVGLGRLVVSPMSLMPAWSIANTVITLVLGGLVAWWLTRSRGLIAERARMRTWTQDTAASVKAVVEQRLLSRLIDAEAALSAALSTSRKDATARIDARMAEIDAELRMRADQRATLLAACDRDLTTLVRGLDRFRGPTRARRIGVEGEPVESTVRPIHQEQCVLTTRRGVPT